VLTVTAQNASRAYNTANPTFTAAYSGFVNSDTSAVLSGAPSLTTTATTSSAAGSYPITAAVGTLKAANYSFSFVNGTLTVTQAAPVITWSNPAAITYGTALSGTQLNASLSVAGSCTYTPAAGTVLAAGTQTLSVACTPTDTTDYSTPQPKTVSLTVNTAVLTVTAQNASRPYNTANPTFTAAYSGFVNSDTSAVLSGAPSLSTSATTSSTAGSYPITAAIGTLKAANYSFSFVNGTLTVTQAAPLITWSNPAAIPYGTALSGTQLNASLSVAGNCIYTPAAGTVLAAGTQTLSVACTPTDTTDYSTPQPKTVSLTVNTAVLTVTAQNASRPYNTANPTFTAAYSGFVNSDTSGVLSGAPSLTTTATTASAAGGYPITAAVGTLKAANYSFSFVNGTLTVTQVTPVITWSNPAAITYGTALSGTQLNASANVAGSFAYTPKSGALLAAGSQTLSTTFTPTDLNDYTTATSSVSLQVNQASPVITWATPAAIPYGTALGGAQLNATANVNGTFAYSPASGTIPALGQVQLAVTFTPTDAVDYKVATAGVTLQVSQAVPIITWNPATPITYPAPLGDAQLNATANVPGAFSYKPAAGAVLSVGDQTLNTVFTPTDAVDYTTANASVHITVNQAAPSISGLSPASALAGTPGLTFTINGANFTADSTVTWNSTQLSFVFVNSTQLTVNVDSTLLAKAGGAAVSVTNGGGTSNIVPFAIQEPAPLGINPDLPDGTVNVFYLGWLQGNGGVPNYNWDVENLPDGFTFFPSSNITSVGPVGSPRPSVAHRFTTAGMPGPGIADNGGVAVDAAGNIYVADQGSSTVTRVGADGTVTLVAGTGAPGYNGDNIPANTAQLNSPWGLAVDAAGNLYIADAGNGRIRQVDPVTGNITTVAGGSATSSSVGGTVDGPGKSAAATSLSLTWPWGVALDLAGNLYIADSGNCRIIESSGGTATVIAGDGKCAFSGDGGPAAQAEFVNPYGIAVDAGNNVFVLDLTGNSGASDTTGRVREIDARSGNINTVAGNGSNAFAFTGDGGQATKASFNDPLALAVDTMGDLYISDTGNGRIRQVVLSTGIVNTVAGIGSNGMSGDTIPAMVANLINPLGIATDSSGNIYVADSGRIRKIENPVTNSYVVIAGTAASPETVTFSAALNDAAQTTVGPSTFSFTVNGSVTSPVTLPAANPDSLPSAVASVTYMGKIDASGGTGPYTWMVGTTPVPADGSLVPLADGLYASNPGGGIVLDITGVPTMASAGSVLQFSVSVTDSNSVSAVPVAYSIPIAAPVTGTTLHGQISGNACNSSLPPITVTLNDATASPVATTTTDGNGNFTFSNVPNGSYTVVPSIVGPNSLFTPATQIVAIGSDNPNPPFLRFSATLGYTVTGSVSYSGSATGTIYIQMVNNSCPGNTLGTSIPNTGNTFTIQGVPPGTYTLSAWMDQIGFGLRNITNPSGITPSVTVPAATATPASRVRPMQAAPNPNIVPVSGLAVTMTDPAPPALTQAPGISGVSAFDQGALVSFKPIYNNGVEQADSYMLQWSTDKTFQSVGGSQTFNASGQNGPEIWIVNNLTNGQLLYFRAAGLVKGVAGPSSALGGPATIGAPAGANTVSGTVTFDGITATGPLYVGFYDQNTGQVYAAQVGSAANPPVSPAPYSVQLPSGNNYYFFGIIDQNNDGLVGPGDITNTNSQDPSFNVAINGDTPDENLVLSAPGTTASVTTQFYQHTDQNGSNQGYNLSFNLRAGFELPVAVTLLSGPNVLAPLDIGHRDNNGSEPYNFGLSVNGTKPNVGDAYQFLITYSDATAESVVATVKAALDSATLVSPTGTGVGTTPTFTWTDPANASAYTYQFALLDSNWNPVWQVPSSNSKSNGLPSTITSLDWGVDPTQATNLPNLKQLYTGSTYNWQITTQDTLGNQAQQTVSFVTAGTPPPLAESASSLPLTATAGQNYTGVITAIGGSGGYSWTVTGLPANGINFIPNGATLTINGNPGSSGPIVFTVVLSDNSSNQVSQDYTINVAASGGGGGGGTTVNGHISQTNCVSAPLPTVTLTLNTTPAQTTQTDGNGNFSFQNVPDGSYTVTPSIAGPSSVFFPAAQNIAITKGSVSGTAKFQVTLGYSVTGMVNYSGTQSGRIYISLNGNNNCNNITPGTSIPGPGPFTVQGVPPGNYTVQAWMDNLGYGGQNDANPVGAAYEVNVPTLTATGGGGTPSSILPAVTPIGGSGPVISLNDPRPVTLTSAPIPAPLNGWGGYNGGASICFNAITDANGVEIPTSYVVQWSADASFSSPAGSKVFPAVGQQLPSYFINGLPNGQNLYFRARGAVGSSLGPWSTASAPVTIGATTGNTISGKITFPGTANGPLYVSVWDPVTGNTAETMVPNPVSPQAYSFQVPNAGTNYLFFAFIDQNNDGIADWGDIANLLSLAGPLTVSGSITQDLVISGASGAATLYTRHPQFALEYGSGGSLGLRLTVYGESKLPVGVTLLSGPNLVAPQDVTDTCFANCSNEYILQPNLHGVAPKIGDTYSLMVTYADNSTQNFTLPVTGVIATPPSNLAPTGIDGSNTTPTFTWSDPADGAKYLYWFELLDSYGNAVWLVPSNLSPTNGLSSDITSLTWGVDPTNPSNKPSQPTLTSGVNYNWYVVAVDPNGNRASMEVNYDPGYQPLSLPTPNPASLGDPTVNQPYSGSISASGGYGAYSYEVDNLSDNLNWYDNGLGTVYISGTPNQTGPVTFQVTVWDTINQYGPIPYTINVQNGPPVQLPPPTPSSLGPALVGYGYGGAINAIGGVGPYTWTVNGTAIPTTKTVTGWGDGSGLVALSSGGNTLMIGGTVAAAPVTLNVTVTDGSKTSASATYTIAAVTGPSGANNGNLKGTYACLMQGFNDGDGTRWASMTSIVANGSGAFTSGIFDMNSSDMPNAISGTLTGAYTVGADNNGLATTNAAVTAGGSGSNTSQWAIALTSAGEPASPAAQFRMVEIDDAGTTPSHQRAMGNCYLAAPGAFTSSTIDSNSFVFGLNGEGKASAAPGAQMAGVGQFSASGGNLSNGYIEIARAGGTTGVQPTSFTGTYATPDPTYGRFTLDLVPAGATAGTPSYTYVAYLIDANRAFMLQTVANGGVMAGTVSKQQQTSYSAANLSGPFVVYMQGLDYSNGAVSGYNSAVLQGSGDGAGHLTLNQSYQDDAGTYKAGNTTGTVPLAFDSSHPGRFTLATGGSDNPIFYLFDTNSALMLDQSGGGGVQSGWVEPQTQTVFTNATLAGAVPYMVGQMPALDVNANGNLGQFTLDSVGNVAGAITTAGQGYFFYDQPMGLTYSWDTTTSAPGTFLLAQGAKGAASCAVISASKAVCTMQSDSSPSILVLQQ